MTRPPYVLRWIDSLCYWVRLSKDGAECVSQSPVGFPTAAEAEAHFKRLFA